MRAWGLLVVLAACHREPAVVSPPRPRPGEGPRVSPAPVTPAPVARAEGRCPATRFAAVTRLHLGVYEVGSDCRARAVLALELDEAAVDLAWPAAGKPIVVGLEPERSVHGVGTFEVLLVDPGTGKAQRRRVPGRDVPDPEGQSAAALWSSGGEVVVERCAGWGPESMDGEEREEWPCERHTYATLDGGRGVARPRPQFAQVVQGPVVVGRVTLERDRRGVVCHLAGHETVIGDHIAGEPALEVLVLPLGGDAYLLGLRGPGGRGHPASEVDNELVRGCEGAIDLFHQDIEPGPDGYWFAQGSIRHGDSETPAVLDEHGAPFAADLVAWPAPL